MAHAQKPDLVFQRNGRVHLNRRGCQFSRLLAVEECGSADSNCIDRVPTYSARLLATHSIRIFPLHFPSRASRCAIRFRTRFTTITTADAHTSAASSRLNWPPASLNGLVRFAERPNLVSARVLSRFRRALPPDDGLYIRPKHVEVFDEIYWR